MENQSSETAEKIDSPPTTSESEDVSLPVNGSNPVGTADNHELSDEISSGSSFEILSTKEDPGEAPEFTDESNSVPPILLNCGEDDSKSESYRVERTKKYVMESEFEFLEDGESSDSDHFVKIARIDMKHDGACESNAEPQPYSDTESDEQLVPMAIPEAEGQGDLAEQPRVPASQNSDCGTPKDDEMDATVVASHGMVTEQLTASANSNVNADLYGDDDAYANIALEYDESESLEEPEENIADADERGSATIHDCLKHHPYINYRLIIVVFVSVIAWLLPRLANKCDGCKYEDFRDNFDLMLMDGFSFPSCLEDSVGAKETYRLAATVHLDQMSHLNLKNATLGRQVSELAQVNRVLENTLAETRNWLSEQLEKNRELENQVYELMAKQRELEFSEHLNRKTELKSSEDPVAYDDDLVQLSAMSSQNKTESPDLEASDLNAAFGQLMKVIKDFHNSTSKQEQMDHERKNVVRNRPPVLLTFLKSFVKTNANASDRNLSDQVAIFEGSFDAIGQCVNRLQSMMPSKTILEIVGLDWTQVQEIVSVEASNQAKTMAQTGETFTLDPCRVFMAKVGENSSDLLSYRKKDLQNYINKTLDAVDKIGQAVKRTLDSIKALPDKLFNNGKLFNSFGQKFKNTIEGMNKRFNKGYGKLKDKLNKKFKSSLGDLSKSVRSGWNKINKRISSVETLLSGAKNRFWKRGAKKNEKQDDSDVARDSVKVQEDIKPAEKVQKRENESEIHSQNDKEANVNKDHRLLEMEKEQRTYSQEQEPLSFSSAEEMNSNEPCGKERCLDDKQFDKDQIKSAVTQSSPDLTEDKEIRDRHSQFIGPDDDGDRDGAWYFKQSESADPGWYSEMIEDRKTGSRVKWYFKNKRQSAQQRQRPLRSGYRGR